MRSLKTFPANYSRNSVPDYQFSFANFLVAKVRKPGYIYIYISNENPVVQEVYFDNLKIRHIKSPAIQYSEYYPFGLQTACSWTRDNTTNNFLYNGGTELNQSSGVYDLFFRNYDPVLGRMNGVDPLAHKYAGLTPYNYAFNEPVFWNDPLGAEPSNSGNKEEKKNDHEDTSNSGDGNDMYGITWEIINILWDNTPDNGFSTWTPGGGAHYFENAGGGMYNEIEGPGSSYQTGMGGYAGIGRKGGVAYIKRYTGVSDTFAGKDGQTYFFKYFEKVAIGIAQQGQNEWRFVNTQYGGDFYGKFAFEVGLFDPSMSMDEVEALARYRMDKFLAKELLHDKDRLGPDMEVVGYRIFKDFDTGKGTSGDVLYQVIPKAQWNEPIYGNPGMINEDNGAFNPILSPVTNGTLYLTIYFQYIPKANF